MDSFECWLPTWDYVYKKCCTVSDKIKESGFKPDIVIALSRGGFVPARSICDSLVIKDLVSIKVDHWGITASKEGKATIRYPIDIDLSGKNVLIVDDITDSGESMLVSLDYVRSKNPKDIKTATAFHIKTSKYKPDYFGEEIDWKWVVFPWNFFEDMRNIIPKVSDGKTIPEIKSILKEKFKADISERDIEKVLKEIMP